MKQVEQLGAGVNSLNVFALSFWISKDSTLLAASRGPSTFGMYVCLHTTADRCFEEVDSAALCGTLL